MGKIIGLFVGFIFGPIGAMVGLFLGFLFDSGTKIFTSGEQRQSDEAIKSGLPVILSYILYKSGYDSSTIHIIKEKLIYNFGYGDASRLMMELRHYNNAHVDLNTARITITNLNKLLPFYSKINFVSFLIEIFKHKGYIKTNEKEAIQEISLSLGINPSIFFGNSYQYTNYEQTNEKTQNRTPRAKSVDPYEILGLREDAGTDEIKKRYRELCMKYHPDKTHSLSDIERNEADNKMREIISAYDLLKKEKVIK